MTELCPGGELYHFIMENKLSPTLCRTFFAQLVSAVAHLHVLSIAHRDIKPENLLLVRDKGKNLANMASPKQVAISNFSFQTALWR